MPPNPMETLLADVAAGRLTPEAAQARLGELATVDLGFARLDGLRGLRQGAPEAVLAEGKTAAEVVAIVTALADVAGSVLVTRADAEVRASVRAAFPDAEEHERARAVWVARARPAPTPRGRRPRRPARATCGGATRPGPRRSSAGRRSPTPRGSSSRTCSGRP